MCERICVKCSKRVISTSIERLRDRTMWDICNDNTQHVWGHEVDWKQQLIWK